MQLRHHFLFLFLLVFTLHISYAQHIDLPEFETPEKNFYRLLEEQKIKSPKNNNGKLKSVTRIFNTYANGKIDATETEVTLFDKNKTIVNHYFIHDDENFDDYSEPPIQYKDSIDGLLRVKIIENEYSFEDYFFKNNRIVKHTTTDEGLQQTEASYSYNSKNKLIKYQHQDFDILYDEDETPIAAAKVMTETEIAAYKDNKLIEKSSYQIWEDLFTVQKLKYTYDTSNKLISYTLIGQAYSTDKVNEDISLDKQNFSEFIKIEDNQTSLKGMFSYNEKGRIATFKIKDIAKDIIVESYKLTYAPNRTIIDANFNNYKELGKVSKLTFKYEYWFDEMKNPIAIKSYYKLNDTFILDIETIIKIEYFKN